MLDAANEPKQLAFMCVCGVARSSKVYFGGRPKTGLPFCNLVVADYQTCRQCALEYQCAITCRECFVVDIINHMPSRERAHTRTHAHKRVRTHGVSQGARGVPLASPVMNVMKTCVQTCV